MWPVAPFSFLSGRKLFRLVLEATPAFEHTATLINQTPVAPLANASDASYCTAGGPVYRIAVSWNNDDNTQYAAWDVIVERKVAGAPEGEWEEAGQVAVSTTGIQTYYDTPPISLGSYVYRLSYTDGSIIIGPGTASAAASASNACAAPDLEAVDATTCVVGSNTNVWQNLLDWPAPSGAFDRVLVEWGTDGVSYPNVLYDGAAAGVDFVHARSKSAVTYYRARYYDSGSSLTSEWGTVGPVNSWTIYPCPPDPPTNVQLSDISTCDPVTMTTTYKLRLTWSNATGVGGENLEFTRIYDSAGALLDTVPASTGFWDPPSPGTTSLSFKVAHVREGEVSVQVSSPSRAAATVCSPPATPSVTGASRSGSCSGGSVAYGSVSITFTTPASSAHATWYTEVQRRISSSDPWENVADVAYPTGSATDSQAGLPSTTQYRVRAYNTSGYDTAWSSAVTVSSSGSCPTPPVLTVSDASTCANGYRFRVEATAPPSGWTLVVKEGTTTIYSGTAACDVYRSATAGASRTFTAQLIKGSESSALDSETESVTSDYICPPDVTLTITGEDTDSIFGDVDADDSTYTRVECDGSTIVLADSGGSFAFHGLTPGTSYTVVARASNTAGTSQDSDIHSTDPLPPPAPTGMNVSPVVLSNTSVRFDFSATGIVDRYWYRTRENGGSWTSYSSTTGSSVTKSVAACTTIECEAYAANDGGNSSSDTGQAVTGGCPDPAPVITSFSATASGQTEVSLGWSATGSGITYTLKRGSTTIYSGSGTGFTDTGLTCNTLYSYTLTASNTGGSDSDTDDATTFVCGGGS